MIFMWNLSILPGPRMSDRKNILRRTTPKRLRPLMFLTPSRKQPNLLTDILCCKTLDMTKLMKLPRKIMHETYYWT